MIEATCRTEARRDRVATGTDVARRRRRARCMKTRAERGSGRRRDHATACFRVGIPSPAVSAAESPDSRSFEQNSNRALLHRIDKTSAKIRPPSLQTRSRGALAAKIASRRASRGHVRAIHATLSRKGSFVPVIQALFRCVASSVRASLNRAAVETALAKW